MHRLGFDSASLSTRRDKAKEEHGAFYLVTKAETLAKTLDLATLPNHCQRWLVYVHYRCDTFACWGLDNLESAGHTAGAEAALCGASNKTTGAALDGKVTDERSFFDWERKAALFTEALVCDDAGFDFVACTVRL